MLTFRENNQLTRLFVLESEAGRAQDTGDMDRRRERPPDIVALMILGGGGLLALGSFLPWITLSAPLVGSISKSGLDGGDGVITLILGIIIVLAGVSKLARDFVPRYVQVLVVIVAIVAAIVAGIDLGDINNRIREAKSASSLISGSTGAGVWTVFVGAALAFIGAIRLPVGLGPRNPHRGSASGEVEGPSVRD